MRRVKILLAICVISISSTCYADDFLSRIDSNRRVEEIKKSGDLLFLAESIFGMDIYDVSNPSNPTLVKSKAPVYADTFDMNNNNIFAVVYNHPTEYLRVYDRTNPLSIEVIAELNLEGSVGSRQASLYQNHLYISAGGLLTVVDVNNPDVPVVTQLKNWDGAGGYSLGIAEFDIKNNTLYASSGTGRLLVLDVANPSTPTFIKTINLTTGSDSLAIIDDYLYLGNGQIFDVSAPQAPTYIGDFTSSITSSTATMDVYEDMLFLTSSQPGGLKQSISVLDVANPLNPTELLYKENYLASYITADPGHVILEDNLAIFNLNMAPYEDYWHTDIYSVNSIVPNSVVPEPASMLLFGLGSLTMAAIKKRKKKLS